MEQPRRGARGAPPVGAGKPPFVPCSDFCRVLSFLNLQKHHRALQRQARYGRLRGQPGHRRAERLPGWRQARVSSPLFLVPILSSLVRYLSCLTHHRARQRQARWRRRRRRGRGKRCDSDSYEARDGFLPVRRQGRVSCPLFLALSCVESCPILVLPYASSCAPAACPFSLLWPVLSDASDDHRARQRQAQQRRRPPPRGDPVKSLADFYERADRDPD